MHHALEMGDHVASAAAGGWRARGSRSCRRRSRRRRRPCGTPLDPRAQDLDRDVSAGLGDPRRWTCAMEAAATGSENSEKSTSTGASSSRSTSRARPRRIGKGGSLSCRTRSCMRKLVAHHVGAGRQDLAELDVGGPERRQRAGRRRRGRIARAARATRRASRAPARRCAARRAPPAPRAPRPWRRCARRWRRCGPAARCCAGPRKGLRASSRNAAPRCPSSGCGTSPARSPPSRIIRRRSPGRGSGGSIRRGTGSCRGRRRSPGPCAGSR
jgi:hypothetical protein